MALFLQPTAPLAAKTLRLWVAETKRRVSSSRQLGNGEWAARGSSCGSLLGVGIAALRSSAILVERQAKHEALSRRNRRHTVFDRLESVDAAYRLQPIPSAEQHRVAETSHDGTTP
jgi:hypothetical protein